MIATEPLLDQVDCKRIFTSIFLATDGQLIQANPHVLKVEMTISKPEGLGFHEQPLDQVKQTDSLWYTKEEFETYRKYLHSIRAREAVQTALTGNIVKVLSSVGYTNPLSPVHLTWTT